MTDQQLLDAVDDPVISADQLCLTAIAIDRHDADIGEVCVWSVDGDGNWWSKCGEGFIFAVDGPRQNKMLFCPFCGKRLRERGSRE